MGKMLLTVYDSDGNLDPVVSFEVLGTLTEQRLEMLQPFIFRELRIARAEERRLAITKANKEKVNV